MSTPKLFSLVMLVTTVRRRLLIVGCLCLCPLLSCSQSEVGAGGDLTVESEEELRQEIEAIINAALPEGENGGPEFLEALEILGEIIGENRYTVDFTFLFLPEDALPDYADAATMTRTRHAFEEAMEQGVMAMIRDAVRRPRLQMSRLIFGEDGFPESHDIRRVASLLTAHARKAAGDSDFDGMLNSFRDALHLSRHLERLPILLWKVTGQAIHIEVLQEFMHLSREHTLPESVLTEMLALVEPPTTLPDETDALIAVEAKLLQKLLRPYFDERGMTVRERRAELFSQANALRWQLSLTLQNFDERYPEVPDEPGSRHLRNFSDWDDVRRELERANETVREWYALPFAERRQLTPLDDLDVRLRPMTLEMMILAYADVLFSYRNTLEITNVRFAGTQLALAIELHRHRNGVYPNSLDELVPGELETLPRDTINEMNFGYRRTSNDGGDPDYILYSAGDNGIDDGGTPCGRFGTAWAGDDPDQPCDYVIPIDRR